MMLCIVDIAILISSYVRIIWAPSDAFGIDLNINIPADKNDSYENLQTQQITHNDIGGSDTVAKFRTQARI